jgi:hypothetical protein
MNTTATFTTYNFDMMMGNQDVTVIDNPYEKKITGARLGYFSGIRDMAVRTDFDYSPVHNHDIKMGISVIHHTFKPELL